ncbi:branched-chain amino acid ABC transporter permease [bacterium]|nr:MAG: branched-chain amino acid ABC transporter permease [bacterium]
MRLEKTPIVKCEVLPGRTERRLSYSKHPPRGALRVIDFVLQLVIAGLTVGSAYALVALGYHVILRATRAINFSQGEFVVLGGLIAYTFVHVLHASPWLGLLGATAAGFALGWIYERIVLRPAARNGDIAVIIATIGCVFILLYGHALIWGSLPQPLPPFTGAQGQALHPGGVAIQEQSLWVFALLAFALFVLWLLFERTTFGKAIRAAAVNPIGAQLVGIDVNAARAASVGIAIALAAFGGTLLGPITLVGGTAGTAIAIKGFVGAVVGGLDSPLGCALGGLAVGVIEKLLAGWLPYQAVDPVVYTLLLFALIVRPQGLLGRRGAVRD